MPGFVLIFNTSLEVWFGFVGEISSSMARRPGYWSLCECHQQWNLLKILGKKDRNWAQAKAGGKFRAGTDPGKSLRCKQVLRKGKQGQWPKCSEDLVPSRGFALPGPWQWDNCGSGHLMAWSCLLSRPHLPWIWASAHHGKMNTQNSPQFIIIPCSLAMPGFQHWWNWKSLSPAQCSDSERLNRATLHRNVHNEVQRWGRSNPSLTGKWAHKIN